MLINYILILLEKIDFYHGSIIYSIVSTFDIWQVVETTYRNVEIISSKSNNFDRHLLDYIINSVIKMVLKSYGNLYFH